MITLDVGSSKQPGWHVFSCFMRYIVGGYSWTRTDGATPWFQKDTVSPGNRRRFYRSDNCTSIYIIYISIQILNSMYHLWILNDTEWGSTPSLLGEEHPPDFLVWLLESPQRSPRSESRYLPKTLSIFQDFKTLNHLWNNHKPDEEPGDQLQFWELHLVNHLLKFGAVRKLGVCTFLLKK